MKLIKEALMRESLNKWQVVTKFHQKPPVSQSGIGQDDVKSEDDEKMEAPKERQMTYAEYEAEYNQCLA